MKQPSERMVKQAFGFIAAALLITAVAIVLDYRFRNGPQPTNPTVVNDPRAQPTTVNASAGD